MVGVLLALLAAGSLLPSTARAGCSSRHASSVTLKASPTSRLELLELAGAVPAGTDDHPGGAPTPCTGAFCTGVPATPLAPSTPMAAAGIEHWAIAALPLASIVPGSVAIIAEGRGERPIALPGSIFRPPRPRPLAAIS